MKKDKLIIFVIIILGVIFYGLTLRGDVGNATVTEFKNNLDQPTNAFELSPERGRYVHVVALAEEGRYDLTREWADIAYPDVGFSQDGRFYSYFAPGVAYLTTPFYAVGSKFNLGQVATFSVESLVSIITLVFMYLIGRRIFMLPMWAAFFAVLVFGFASTSWSYAITLYQNAFTTCLIVTSVYAVWRYSKKTGKYDYLYAGYIWFAYALAIFVDYPNVILMLPVMIYLAFLTFSFKKVSEGFKFSIRYTSIVMAIVFVLVTGLHFWHNTHYYGDWKKLSGGLRSMSVLINAEKESLLISSTSSMLAAGDFQALDNENIISTSTTESTSTTTASQVSAVVADKDVVGFFEEEKIPHGLYILLVSDERGLFFFTPIFLFVFLGVRYLFKKKEENQLLFILMLSLIAVNIFLYSSWGDPWGGWAFGPRYLIPSMPWMAILVGVALYKGKSLLEKSIAYTLFLYSSAISLLAALTTNAVPTKGEGSLLPAKTYNFLYNLPFFKDGRSGSFVYKTFLSDHITLSSYFSVIFILIASITAITLFYFSRINDNE